MVSKYEPVVWEVLDFQEIKSTNQIKLEVEMISRKVVNWFTIHRILKEYVLDGKAELLKSNCGLFWRKK